MHIKVKGGEKIFKIIIIMPEVDWDWRVGCREQEKRREPVK